MRSPLHLRGGTIITATDGSVPVKADLIIEDERIAAIGRESEFGSRVANAAVVDLTGKFIVPGYVNAHDHLTTKRVRGTRAERAMITRDEVLLRALRNAFVNLREGVTTLRDAGSSDGLALKIRDQIGAGNFVGPRIVAVAEGITDVAGYAHAFFREVGSPLEARKAAAEMIKQGADWIKCMASIEWELGQNEPMSALNLNCETMRAAFDIAHHHGKRCMAHALADDAIRAAVEAGADTIEHGIYLSEPTAEIMAKKGVFLVPTLSGYREHSNDWGRGNGTMIHGRLLAPHQIPAIRLARKTGITIALGTDTLGNIGDEIGLLVEGGFPLQECLSILTKNGAELVGMSHEIGTISVGKFADLVVLNSNPLATAEAFTDIAFVVKSGIVIEPESIPIRADYL
jgi:imidazolonepropionase-like amidohydrolase